MKNILQSFRHALLNPSRNPADLYDFDFGAFADNLTVLICTILILVNNSWYLKIMSQVYCVKTESESTTIIKTTKMMILEMKYIKFVFYRQRERFVVQYSIANISSLILFYFQWK